MTAENLQPLASGTFFCISGTDAAGEPLFHVVKVSRLKESVFKKALKQPLIELSKYGRIIYSSRRKPSARLLQLLKDNH